MTNAPRDYHDYVFANGRLIGDFEGMYRHSAEVPWHQDRTAYDISADLDIAILRKRRFRSVCDVGSGLGYFTARLQDELSTPDDGTPELIGLEISPTAAAEASRRRPGIRFVVADLLDDAWSPPRESFDLVVARDIIWYVCHELDKFLERLVAMAGNGMGGGMVHVSQSFPNTDQWVGQDVVGSPEELLDHLRRFVGVVYTCAEHDVRWEAGSVLHVLGRVS